MAEFPALWLVPQPCLVATADGMLAITCKVGSAEALQGVVVGVVSLAGQAVEAVYTQEVVEAIASMASHNTPELAITLEMEA